MIQEIKYGGVSANPSDYECADGQLALSIGLLPEDGALKPVLPPKILFAVPEGDEVVYIHRTAVFCYYLVWRAQTGDLFYTEGDTESTPLLQPLRNFGNTEIESYAAVGNTLIVLASDGANNTGIDPVAEAAAIYQAQPGICFHVISFDNGRHHASPGVTHDTDLRRRRVRPTYPRGGAPRGPPP